MSNLSLAEVNDLRLRVVNDENVSVDEIKEAVTALRQERMTAAASKKKAGSKAAPVSLLDLAANSTEE